MENLENILMLGFGIIIAALIFLIVIYIVLGIVLNKLNKRIYGRGTALAWIPLCDIYLLGKLTVSKFFGFILLLFSLLNSSITLGDGQNKMVYTLIPEEYKWIYSLVYSILFIILFIVAIVKLNKLGKSEETFINEVYLNQKTKQEIMEEDAEIKLVKWDDNEESANDVKTNITEENNIPFQNLINQSPIVEEKQESINNIINNEDVNILLENKEKPLIDKVDGKEKISNSEVTETYNHENENQVLQEKTEELHITDEVTERLQETANNTNNSEQIDPIPSENKTDEIPDIKQENIMEETTENDVESNLTELSEVLNEKNKIEHDEDIEEEYDYDNPKIQEAIDNIVHKEKSIQNSDNK